MVAIASGAILAGRCRPPREAGRSAYAAVLVLGAATLGFGLVRAIVLAVLLGLAFGAGQQLAELWWTTSLQHNIPDRLRGRIIAVDHFGSFVFLPLSFVVGGVVVEAVSAEVVLLAAGATGMLAAAIGLAVPAVHRWRPVDSDLAARAAARRDPRTSSAPGRPDLMTVRPAVSSPPARVEATSPFLSEAIRAARRRAGLSQVELAELLGVRQSSGQPVGAGKHHSLGGPPAGARRRAGARCLISPAPPRCHRQSRPSSGHRLIGMGGAMLDLGDAIWRTSTYSALNGCVEVAFVDGLVAIRDSNDRQGHALLFTPTEWRAFIHGIRDGQFDLPGCGGTTQEPGTRPA